jgi:hypothetical protein
MNGRPSIVCLCGSTKFQEAFAAANKRETLAGRIVLTVGYFGHQEETPPTEEQKALLDRLHKAKIDLADEILVLNVGGYIGESTAGEIDHALIRGKRIRYWEPFTGQVEGP